MRNGNKSGRGCKKGKEYKFFHPPICRNSLKTGMCLKKDFRYHHIKSTWLPFEDNFERSANFRKTASGNSSRQHANLNNFKKSLLLNEDMSPLPDQPSYATIVSTSLHFHRKAFLTWHRKDWNTTPLWSNRRHQIQIQKLFLLGSPPQAAIDRCRCQTKCH